MLLACTTVHIDTIHAEGPADEQKNLFADVEKKKIPFSFDKKLLVDIIEDLASILSINVIMPSATSDSEALKKQTITYHSKKNAIPVKEAFTLLNSFLELSGFSIYQKNAKTFGISRIGKQDLSGISQETLPLYVNTPPDQLPPERIRYIGYLENLHVPRTTEEQATNPLSQIFKDMLSPTAPAAIWDPRSNGFILVDRGDVIASVVTIIDKLDNTGFHEMVEVIPLFNATARDIAKVFEGIKKAAGAEAEKASPFIRQRLRPDSINYFAGDTVVIADDRNNSIILMGREAAVTRIRDFIIEYMDALPESGNSVLHTYDLQFLDATTFADVLTKVVTQQKDGGQTKGENIGPERFFEGVVIEAEKWQEFSKEAKQPGQIATKDITLAEGSDFEAKGITGTTYTGGNRLIIAAVNDDWIRIKNLIDELDRPEPQVILEVLIVDFTNEVQKVLASTIRNKTQEMAPSNGFQFLSSNISPVNNVLGATPAQLAQDLLGLISTSTVTPVTGAIVTPGSLLISYNDVATPGIFGLFQTLNTIINGKIITHPYLVTTNNQKATITSQTIQRARGNAIPSTSGAVTIEIVNIPATIQVQMIPRLSSFERLSLQIAVDINQFEGSSLNRTIRRVETNANMSTGQILVIGGLTEISSDDVKTDTPLLERIPIIGNFFKQTNKDTTRTNLSIFISPTIVQTKLREGLHLYTTDKVRKSRRDVGDQIMFGSSNNRDPITRLFFNNGRVSDDLLIDYLQQASNKPSPEQIKTTREKREEARTAHFGKKAKPEKVKSVQEIIA